MVWYFWCFWKQRIYHVCLSWLKNSWIQQTKQKVEQLILIHSLWKKNALDKLAKNELNRQTYKHIYVHCAYGYGAFAGQAIEFVSTHLYLTDWSTSRIETILSILSIWKAVPQRTRARIPLAALISAMPHNVLASNVLSAIVHRWHGISIRAVTLCSRFQYKRVMKELLPTLEHILAIRYNCKNQCWALNRHRSLTDYLGIITMLCCWIFAKHFEV